MGPNALRYSERVLAILRAGGLPPDLAVKGSHLLIATVNGFTAGRNRSQRFRRRARDRRD